MELLELNHSAVRIKVIGVGGGGGNAVDNMVRTALNGVDFIAANTDMQALNRSLAGTKIQLGQKLTRGLGAGGDPAKGCEAAKESIVQIQEAIGEADMVFVTAGMGGGTGTGAAPIIAQAAREMGILTVGVITKPFSFEGKRRMLAAEAGIAELRMHVDSLLTIPNARLEKLEKLTSRKATFRDMLKKADNVLCHAVQGISDLLVRPGLINLDFADVKAVMGGAGLALMGAGVASGESRAREAAMSAITSPLLEDVSIEGARGVLFNITATSDLAMEEISEAAGIIGAAVHEDASIYFGAVHDEEAGDEMRVTVIATGMDNAAQIPENRAKGAPQVFTASHPQPGVRLPLTEKNANQRGGAIGGGFSAYSPASDFDEPTFLRMGVPGFGMGLQLAQAVGHNLGVEEFFFDDDMEAPTFIRKP